MILGEEVRINFDGGRIRQLILSDVHSGYVDGLNDAEVNKYLVGVRQNNQTYEVVKAFVQGDLNARDSILFGIWCNGMKEHCGTIRIHEIENIHKTAHIGICLFDKSVWGNKVGVKSLSAVTQWVFKTLKLRWIEAGVYSENIASERAFLSAGYEWIYDIPDKYLFEGNPAKVKIFASRNLEIK
jgi:RimJ/RimL family protein N-acetyltransferase